MANAKRIQDGIKQKLGETTSCPAEDAHKLLFRRSQQLNICMEVFLNEVERQNLAVKSSVQSEHGSVLLGEISPHHDNYDSKSSSETPPTYNQLNYNENLNRYFNSRPVTFAPVETQKMNSDQMFDSKQQVLSPMQQSGEESGDSVNSSTESSNNSNETNDYQAPNLSLTEVLLSRHNNEIEKQMLKRHKMERFSGRIIAEKLNKGADKTAPNLNNRGYGIKRSGSHSWDNELHKNSKQHHSTDYRNNEPENSPVKYPIPQNTMQNPQQADGIAAINENTNNNNNNCSNDNDNNNKPKNENSGFVDQTNTPLNVNLWPPFSVSVPTVQSVAQSALLKTARVPSNLQTPTYISLPPMIDHTRLIHNPDNRFPYYDDLSNRQLNAQPKLLSDVIEPTVPYRPFQHLAGLMSYPHQSMLDSRLVYPHPPIMYQPIPFTFEPTSTVDTPMVSLAVSFEFSEFFISMFDFLLFFFLS